VYFALPMIATIAIYITAAVLPAVFLMRYIYRMDTIEKEPQGLLFALLRSGALASLAAFVLERMSFGILSPHLDHSDPAFSMIVVFLIVALVEEGAKFYFLKRRTWRDPNFNYRFDGIVYAVFVSLGFAAVENINYILGYGLTVAVPRAFLAIPGHMGFAVFMGLFYGRAKLRENNGDRVGKNMNLWAGYLSAVLLHGLYNACATMGTVLSTGLFLGFVAVMYIVVIRLIKKESASDRPI